MLVPDRTLPEFLLAAASERADRPALIDGPSGRTLTYQELADGVRRVAAGFVGGGLGAGDVLAVMAPNSPEWLLGCYGAMAAGGVVTGVNPLYTVREAAAQLVQTDARFVLTVPPFLDTVRAAIAESGGRREIVLIGPESHRVHPVPAAARAR